MAYTAGNTGNKPSHMSSSMTSYIMKCHCGKRVLKMRICDAWYTLCDVCYRDSFPHITEDQLREHVEGLPSWKIREIVKYLTPYSKIEVVRRFLETAEIEEVERVLDGK